MLRLLRRRDFALLFGGQLISQAGDFVLFVALPFWVYRLTGSTTATGIMFAALTVPQLLLSPVAGVTRSPSPPPPSPNTGRGGLVVPVRRVVRYTSAPAGCCQPQEPSRVSRHQSAVTPSPLALRGARPLRGSRGPRRRQRRGGRG
jgi:hypothetical protein